MRERADDAILGGNGRCRPFHQNLPLNYSMLVLHSGRLLPTVKLGYSIAVEQCRSEQYFSNIRFQFLLYLDRSYDL